MMYVTYALRRCFAKRGREDVYVGSNNFLYSGSMRVEPGAGGRGRQAPYRPIR